MNARSTPVAAVQLAAHDRASFAEVWPAIVARLARAADDGARLIVVPEGTVPAYVIGTEPVDTEQIEAAIGNVIEIAARSGATIVIGGARPGADGTANSAYVVTADGVAGFADKCFLWHFDRRWFRAGDALAPIETPVGRLGVFICADGRIPTIAARLAERGAEILVVPTAWVSSGRDAGALENAQADLMIPVRARENGLPVVAANKVGVEARSVLYCGKSQIVAADGSIVALASQGQPETLHAAVTLAARPPRERPASVERGNGGTLPAALRIAFSARPDPQWPALAATADAALTIDSASIPASSDIAVAGDDAVLDPRALVAPRLDGVRLFVWRPHIEERWIVPFARTRAAELRAYVLVLDERRARAFAVDPDGTVVAGTAGRFELAAFAFDRARTEVWNVAPATDVRAGLERVAAIADAGR